MKKGKYHQGTFKPRFPEKYVGNVNDIVWRSSWERTVMKHFDLNPAVIKWASEELIIPYISPVDKMQHRYFPDFVVLMRNRAGKETKYVIEVKPYAETEPPKGVKKTKRLLQESMTYAVNQAKWNAAKLWCHKRGFEFMVLTENEIYGKKK